jgi:hypothetical protein
MNVFFDMRNKQIIKLTKLLGGSYSAFSLYRSEKGVILIAKGMEHVPSTLTTLKLLNRALKPSFCKHRANRLAAIFA